MFCLECFERFLILPEVTMPGDIKAFKYFFFVLKNQCSFLSAYKNYKTPESHTSSLISGTVAQDVFINNFRLISNNPC